MPSYLVRTLHRPAAISLLAASLSGLAILVVTPIVARAADRLASRKTLQYLMLVVSLAAAWPVFRALLDGIGDSAALVMITIFVAGAVNNAGPASVLMMEAFPLSRRAAAMAVIYSTGVVVFGGFSPLAVTWLIDWTGSPMVPAWYLTTAMVISLVGLHHFPEQRQRSATT